MRDRPVGRPRRRLVDDDRRARVGADRQRASPATTGRRPEPGARVLAARPEHRRDGDAAAHGEVAPQRAGGRLDVDALAGADGDGGASSADVATTTGPSRAHPEPAERLQHGGVGRVADQPVEQLAAVGVDGAARRDAEVRRGRAGRRPGWSSPSPASTTTSSVTADGTNRTAVARARSSAGGRGRVPQGRRRCVPIRCQPPGDARRVHGGVLGGDGHRRRPAPASAASAAGAGAAPGRARCR